MTEQKQSLSQRWEEYRPSKTALFWSCAASVAATLIVGFAWGGWVTGGTASQQAEQAANAARAELAAVVCVERFVKGAEAGVQLAALKNLGNSTYRQRKFLEDGGWATIAGGERPISGAADLCAKRLVELEIPPAEATAISEETQIVQ